MDEADAPWTRVGAHGWCVRGDEVLLVRLSPDMFHGGHWALPGGGIDWGEDPIDALHRELREETACTGRVGDVLGVFSDTYMRTADRRSDSLHFLSIVFEVHDVDGEIVDEVGGSTDHAEWVPLSSLGDAPLAPLARFALERWRARR